MQIILEVPDRLVEKLQRLGDQLPETLDLLLQDIPTTETISYQDDRRSPNCRTSSKSTQS